MKDQTEKHLRAHENLSSNGTGVGVGRVLEDGEDQVGKDVVVLGAPSDVEVSLFEQNLRTQGYMFDLNTGTVGGLDLDDDWDQVEMVVGYQDGTSNVVGSHTEGESGKKY